MSLPKPFQLMGDRFTSSHYGGLFIVIMFLILSFNPVVCNGEETYNVYSWGLNLIGQTGIDYPTPEGFTFRYNTPIVNNHLTSLIFENSTSLYESVYGIRKPNDISISIHTIIPGSSFNLYWLVFTDTSSNESFDHLFSCGDNTDFCAGLNGPKFTTELQVMWEYSDIASKREMAGSIGSKRLHSIDCMFSCIACTTDGTVFVKALHEVDWRSVTIPSNLVDSLGSTVSNKCEKVAVGGSSSKETFFAMSEDGHVFSWGDFNNGMRGYEESESSGVSPHLISSIYGAYYIAALKDFISYPDELGVFGFINDTGVYMIGKNSNGLFAISPDEEIKLVPHFVTSASMQLVSKFKKLVFGYAMALVLGINGEVFVFGGNEYGQVNPEDIGTMVNFPKPLSNMEGASDCSCSNRACACVINSNTITSWGSPDERGWEGDEFFVNIPFEEPISNFTLLNMGGFAISETNKIYSWGDNTNGYLCLADKFIQTKPKLLFTTNYPLKQLVSGQFCSYSLGSSGDVVNMWGNCSNGLDFGIPSNAPSFHSLTALDKSVHLQDRTYTQISMYNAHAAFLSSTNQPYTIGYGMDYRLGTTNFDDRNFLSHVDTTTLVSEEIIQVSAGFDHTIYLSKSGYLMGSGNNQMRQLDIDVNSYFILTNVSTTPIEQAGERIVQAVAGRRTTFVLTDAGRVWARGSNTENQISNLQSSFFSTFTSLPTTNGFANLNITKLAVGTFPIMIDDNSGQAHIFNKTMTTLFIFDDRCVDVYAREDTYYILTKTGKVYGIGPNSYYQIYLKNGLAHSRYPSLVFTPQTIGGIPKMMSIGDGFTNVAVLVPTFTCQGKNFSDPTVCNGRGYCYAQDQCKCTEFDWSGSDCSQPVCIATESGKICDGHGVCVGPGLCKCDPGYYGDRCEDWYCFGKFRSVFSPTGQPCNNRGSCTAPDKCECYNPQFYGDECQFKRCFGGNGAFMKRNTLADRLCNKINSQILNIPYPIPTGNMTGVENPWFS